MGKKYMYIKKIFYLREIICKKKNRKKKIVIYYLSQYI